MFQKIKTFLGRYAAQHHYPYLGAAALVAVLMFEFVPGSLMPGHRWVFLVSVVATVLCCVDLNLMLWRVYHRRGDLQPLRVSLALLSGFFTLMTISRVLGFAAFFFETLLAAAATINLLSGLLAVTIILKARTAESYVMGLPRLADLHEANNDLRTTQTQLHLREQMAFEAMLVSSHDTIMEANPMAYQVLGYCAAKNELIGMRAHQLVHEDDHPIVYKHLREAHTAPYTVRALTKNGEIRHIQVVGENFSRQEGDVLRLTNFRDVTYERRYLRLVEDKHAHPAPETPAALNDQLLREINELRSTYFPDHFPPAAHALAD